MNENLANPAPTLSRRAFLAGLAGGTLPAWQQAGAATQRRHFLVIGDWGTGTEAQRLLAQEFGRCAASISASFVISTGDNFYADGVESINDPQWRTSFEEVYHAPSLMVPWYAVLGNHDHRGNVRAQIDYTTRSTRWRMPSAFFVHTETLDDGTRADFFFLDTETIRKEHASWTSQFFKSPQVAWLEQSLPASRARWKIVVGHHPIYSGERRKDSKALQELVAPLLERHGVQIYLNGHSHILEHVAVRNVHYVTSGAGARPRKAEPLQNTRFLAGGQLGFLVSELAADAIRLEFRDERSSVLYSVQI